MYVNDNYIEKAIFPQADVRRTEYGPDVTIGDAACVLDSTLRRGVKIETGAIVERAIIGSYSTVAKQTVLEHVQIPPSSYVESCSDYGTGYDVLAVWTPKGLYIKPGCMKLEPVQKTLDRLSQPHKIAQWFEYYDDERKAWAKDWIKWLKRMQRYEVV